MDPKVISDSLIGIGSLIGIAVTALSATQRRARARARQQATDLEAATTYIMASRRGRHRHNDEHHPGGDGAIDLPDLPAYLIRGDE